MRLEVIRKPEEMQKMALAEKARGKRIALVPTMGALHEGHRELIRQGRKRGDILITTLFVNPKQFGPGEDLDRYPRTFERDLELCEKENVDFLFFPGAAAMYPEGFATSVQVSGITQTLCGASRPHFFEGVTTVCLKLFLITQADVAVFGWKDAQQQLVIRRMVQDLNLPLEIMGVETVREADGLALSSRNQYLNEQERAEVPVLYRALQAAQRAYRDEKRGNAAALRQMIVDKIESESQGRIDYVEVVSTETLQPVEKVLPSETLIALAVFWGETRLIDNVRL